MNQYQRVLGPSEPYNTADLRVAGNPLVERFRQVPWLFVLIVVAPTLVATVYYLLIAAPIYVSEAQFVVRNRSQPQAAAFGNVLQSVGISMGQAESETYEVEEFIKSRDAAQDLARHHNLRAIMARPEADFIARFPRPFEADSFENLFRSYQRRVEVEYDSNTGIGTIRVEGFRPGDARDLTEALLGDGEALVNRLNLQAEEDTLTDARREVTEAEAEVLKAQGALTDFRNRQRMIDPDKASVAGLELTSKLEAELIELRAQRASLAASAPQSPQLPVLDRHIAAFTAQMGSESARIAGESDSLAPKMGAYEQLVLQRDFAVKSLASAETALETARIDVRRKQLYLERVVTPNTPDKAVRPRRLLAIFTVAVSTLLIFGTLSLMIAGLREHQQK